MEARIRPAEPTDATGWCEVVRATTPYLVTSPESVAHDQRTATGHVSRAVAVVDGTVVGVARVRHDLDDPDKMGLTVHVHPDHQGNKVGRLLLEWCHERAGTTEAKVATGIVNGDTRTRAVAQHWGLELLREHTISAVDPRDVSDSPAEPPDHDLRSAEDAGARAVWECHQAVAHDDPSGLSRPMAFDDFLGGWWQDPVSRPALGRAVMVDGSCVAFTSLSSDGDRAWSAMTGVLSEHRGRGLARLVKANSLRAAAAVGVTRCATANDAANTPMLAVNQALGYRPLASAWGAERTLR